VSTWADRLYDARFSAEETTAWERLVADGLGRDEATEEMLRIRRVEAEAAVAR
jgi:hypothetical protein